MHRIPWILRKITSFILIFFLLTDGSAGASAVQVNLHENIPPLPGDHHSAWIRSLPAALGTAEVKLQGMGPMLVHLQTAHGDPEAQTKISEILAYLKANAGIQTVLVEGSSEALDSNRLDFERLYPGRGDVIQGALLRRGWLKGPELFLVRESGVQALGIENRDAYLANGRALLSVLAQSDQSAALIGILQSRVQSLSTLLLRSSTRELLKNYEAWTDHRLPLEAWVPTLQKALETSLRFNFQDPSAQFEAPMLTRFVLLLKLHEGEAPEAYESEKKSLFQTLQDQAGDELQACLKALLDRDPDPFGAGVEDAAQTLRRTLELMPPSVTIEKYPHVIRRFQSLMLQDEIDFRALHQEIERLTQLALEAGTDREDERLMLRWIRDWTRYKKIVSLNALPSDLEEVTMNLSVNRPRALMRRLQDLSARYPSAGDPMPDLEGLELLHEKALVFYRRARERDFYMLQNIERILKERRISRAAVVTGGFHAKPFEDYFRDKRRNYIRVIPAISGVSSRDVYIRSALDLGLRYTESQTWETPFISDPTFLPPDLQTVLHRPNNPASGSIKTIGRGRSLMSVRSRVSLGEEAINAPPKGIYGEARNRSELRSQGESETQPPVIFKFFWELTEDERESLLKLAVEVRRFPDIKDWEKPYNNALIALVQGEPAGMQAFELSTKNRIAYARGLYVRSQYRRQGLRVATRLRTHLLRYLSAQGYQLFITTVATNPEAQGFHEKWIERLGAGVQVVGRRNGLITNIKVRVEESLRSLEGTHPLDEAVREAVAPLQADEKHIPIPDKSFGHVDKTFTQADYAPQNRSELRSQGESETQPPVIFKFFWELTEDERESLLSWFASINKFNSAKRWEVGSEDALVAYIDGRPAGVQAFYMSRLTQTVTAEGLFVAENYRRNGMRLGSRLRGQVLRRAHQEGYSQFETGVALTEEAQDFHEAWIVRLEEAVIDVDRNGGSLRWLSVDIGEAVKKMDREDLARAAASWGSVPGSSGGRGMPAVTFRRFFFHELARDSSRESLATVIKSWGFFSWRLWTEADAEAHVICVDGKPVGAQAYSVEEDSSAAFAAGLYILPEYRGKPLRLAYRLREAWLQDLKNRNIREASIYVSKSIEAQSFHRAWARSLGEAAKIYPHGAENSGVIALIYVDPSRVNLGPTHQTDALDSAKEGRDDGNGSGHDQSVPQNRSELRGQGESETQPPVIFKFFWELTEEERTGLVKRLNGIKEFSDAQKWSKGRDEALIAYVAGSFAGIQAFRLSRRVHVSVDEGLYVEKHYRRNGLRLASRLREGVIRELHRRGATKFKVTVALTDEAQAFHTAWMRSMSGAVVKAHRDEYMLFGIELNVAKAVQILDELGDVGSSSSPGRQRSELRSQGEFETQPPVIFKFFWELTNAERKSLFDWLSGLGDYWNNRSWDANVNDALIAIVGGKPQGIQAFSEAKSASTVISAGLYVAETYRRSGQYIGSQLRDRVLRELWRRGLRIFQISVAPEPEAQAFHENWIKIMGDSVLAVTREGDKLRWITIDVEKGVKKIEGQDLVQDAETRSALSPNPSGSVMPAVTFRRIFFHELDRDSSSEYLVSVIKSWEFFNSLWANRSAQAYVVYVHGFPAGAQAFTIDQENGTAEARGIFVSQDYRGKHLKLAYKLRETWLKQMQKEGLSEAWIYVNDSPASQRFHKEWARSLGAAVSPYGTTEDNSDLISGLDIDLKKLIWPERAESGSPADQVPGDTGPVDEDALEAPGKQARSELRRLFEAGNDEHSRLAKPSRNPDILRRRIGLFEKVSELRRFYRLRLWLLTESDRTMNLVDQRAFLSLMIGLKVRLFSDAFRVQSAAPILPAGALRPSPSYHRQIEESHLEGGRVLIDGEWILDWGRRNPRGLYVLADSSARLAERMKQPAAALLGDSGVTSKLLEILLNRDSTLGSAERSRVRRLAESGRFEKSFETVPRSEAEAYARRHDGGVAHLHGPESGLALTAADFRLSLDPSLGPSDECAAAWVLPGLLRAASLIRGIKDVSEQRDVLRSRLQDIFPGSSWSPGGILIRIDEAFVRKIVAERLVETAA